MTIKKRESTWDIAAPAKPKKPEIKAENKAPWDEDDEIYPPAPVKASPAGDFVDSMGTPVVEVAPMPKPKKKRITKPSKPEPELHIDFEDLDIEPPFVDEFKEEYGAYPILSVKNFCKLPLRYDIGTGKTRFRMQSFEKGDELKVTGTESGKKVKINILCKHRSEVLVLEPNMITRFCKVINPLHSSFRSLAKDEGIDLDKLKVSKTKKAKIDPAKAKEFQEAIEKRKREAMFSI